jgi:formylglycine-generating enzyme required for sulfatase activity
VREALVKWMLEVPDPAELIVVRNALRPHGDELRGGLWRQLELRQLKPERRLRLLAALAAFDPQGAGWQQVNEKALAPWLADNPLYLGVWIDAFREARAHLMAPLTRVFRDGTAERRSVTASILAEYAKDQPALLVDLIVQADDRQFAALLPALQRWRDRGIPLLVREVNAQAEPGATEAAREALARRQSAAGLTLARLEQLKPVWSVLKHSPYPEARTRLIARLGPNGVPASTLVARLQTEKEVSVRRALVLALGEYTAEQMPIDWRQRLVPLLLDWYRSDPDSGIHGAIDWLLRHAREGPAERPLDWGQARALEAIDRERAGKPPRQKPETQARGNRPEAETREGATWYVNGQGQTLAIVDSREPFLMGSPSGEKGRIASLERQHWRRIGRRYAIGTKPVTVAQWQQFLKGRFDVPRDYPKQYSPEPGGPMIFVAWYMAAEYCNWLSEKEGIPKEQWCYPEKIEAAMKPVPGYLKRTGYRLPTGAEWEFACRAGARTSRYYGSSDDLLPRYAWYMDNARERTWPVGQKRPNDLGLFDMHGNVWTWCHDRAIDYPGGSAEDKEDTNDILSTQLRILRGATFNMYATYMRSAVRNTAAPAHRHLSFGLRVARTVP